MDMRPDQNDRYSGSRKDRYLKLEAWLLGVLMAIMLAGTLVGALS